MPASFAIYRMPHADHALMVKQLSDEPEELLSCSELNGRRGYVVAPFEIKPEQPILLIRPDAIETVPCDVGGLGNVTCATTADETYPDSTYTIDFANFHSQLELGSFRKIVLARSVTEQPSVQMSPMELFLRACRLYPRMFISLAFTPKSGLWLTATPEILLEGKGNDWHTIALAGTMRLEGAHLQSEGEGLSWSTKNIQEQRIVATYITECLEQYTSSFTEEGPCTVRAANLVHLRSDFAFTLPDRDHIGDLLGTLHPTPAVCGLPKRDAFNFIIHNEHTPRRYYCGFMGMLDPEGETHLYVSLRCMNIDGTRYHLFAGGGLLNDSCEDQEWQETEAKLQTMRSVLFKSE